MDTDKLQFKTKIPLSLEVERMFQRNFDQRAFFRIPEGQLNDEDTLAILHFFGSNKTLQGLELSRRRFRGRSLRNLLKTLEANTTLRYLSLVGGDVTDIMMEQLCRLFRSNSTLTTLMFGKASFTNSSMHKLVDTLRHNTTLEALDLSQSEVTDTVIDKFQDVFGEKSTIHDIHLGNSEISEKRMLRFLNSLKANSTLRHLNLENSVLTDVAVSEFPERHPTLRNLCFRESTFTDEGMSQLFSGLNANRSLKQLSFEDSKLSDRGAAALGVLCRENSTLTDLQFGSSEFSDESIEKLSNTLRGNRTLQSLNFTKGKLTDSTVDTLCDFLKDNTVLTHLDVCVESFEINTFYDLQLEELLNALAGNSALCLLSVNSRGITDKGMLTLMKALKTMALGTFIIDEGSDRHLKWALGIINEPKDDHIIDATIQEADGTICLEVTASNRIQTKHVYPGDSVDKREGIKGASEVQVTDDSEWFKVLTKRFDEASDRAMSTGSQTVCQARVMVIGHHGDDKTSLLDSLLDELFSEKSTVGLNIHKVNADSPSDWTYIDDSSDGYVTRLAHLIRKYMIEEEYDAMHCALAGSESEYGTLNDTRLLPSNVRNELRSEIRAKGDQAHIPRELFFWDLPVPGHQHAVTECLAANQLLMTARGVYMLVVNIATALSDPDQGGSDRDKPSTVGGFLDFWMSAVYSQGPDEHKLGYSGERGKAAPIVPKVIIIGTHGDMITRKETNKFVEMIHSLLATKPYAARLHAVFTISNQSPEKLDIRQIRKALYKLASERTYELPLSWFKVRDELVTRGHKVRRWEDVVSVGMEAGVEEEDELRMVLYYFHSLGEVVFLDDPQLDCRVVTDPRWLVDQMATMLRLTSEADGGASCPETSQDKTRLGPSGHLQVLQTILKNYVGPE